MAGKTSSKGSVTNVSISPEDETPVSESERKSFNIAERLSTNPLVKVQSQGKSAMALAVEEKLKATGTSGSINSGSSSMSNPPVIPVLKFSFRLFLTRIRPCFVQNISSICRIRPCFVQFWIIFRSILWISIWERFSRAKSDECGSCINSISKCLLQVTSKSTTHLSEARSTPQKGDNTTESELEAHIDQLTSAQSALLFRRGPSRIGVSSLSIRSPQSVRYNRNVIDDDSPVDGNDSPLSCQSMPNCSAEKTYKVIGRDHGGIHSPATLV